LRQSFLIRCIAEKDGSPILDNTLLSIRTWDDNPEITTAPDIIYSLSYFNSKVIPTKLAF